MSEDSGILISNTSIMHDDVVPRVDLGIQTISDWCTESIPSGVGVSIQTESHCVCRCDDSHMVHHVSNTDINASKIRSLNA